MICSTVMTTILHYTVHPNAINYLYNIRVLSRCGRYDISITSPHTSTPDYGMINLNV